MNGLRSGSMPGLLALVAAVLCWWGSDTAKEERKAVESQNGTALRLLERGREVRVQDLQLSAREAAQRRQGLTERLRSESSLQAARAELFYELRQKCNDLRLSCAIRLSDMGQQQGVARVLPGSSSASGAASGRRDDILAPLGVERVRGSISGALGREDISQVLRSFQMDPRLQWRVNRVQVKGRNFEIDVERHVIPART